MFAASLLSILDQVNQPLAPLLAGIIAGPVSVQSAHLLPSTREHPGRLAAFFQRQLNQCIARDIHSFQVIRQRNVCDLQFSRLETVVARAGRPRGM